jgi:hypothetical protein
MLSTARAGDLLARLPEELKTNLFKVSEAVDIWYMEISMRSQSR